VIYCTSQLSFTWSLPSQNYFLKYQSTVIFGDQFVEPIFGISLTIVLVIYNVTHMINLAILIEMFCD